MNRPSTSQADFYNEELSYDSNGNISSLKRNGPSFGSNNAMLIDNLDYAYLGNRLTSVRDDSYNSSGYPACGGQTISYADNGNMINHSDKGISKIVYNDLNLPSTVNTAAHGNISCIYRADGVKVYKSSGTGAASTYLDGFQYDKNGLQFVPTAEGYYDCTKNSYIYNYVDHLGNVRISYTKNSAGVPEILEENNYYPCGLKHEGYNTIMSNNPAYKYKYNGKELQETGMYDYGARFYMPDVGRWGVVDPLAEKAPGWTPYRYGFNNPIKYTDPKGLFETKFGAW